MVQHIKQVSGEPHAAQINLLHHQRMELPHHKHNKKKSHAKCIRSNSKLQHRNDLSHGQKIKGNHFLPSSNKLPPSGNHNQCSKCGDTAHQEGFTCPAKKYQCKVCHKFGHFTSQCFQKKQYHQQKYRQPKAHQIQIEESHSYIHDYLSESSSVEDSFCLQVKVQRPNKKTQQPSHITHLITNIPYKLKPHHTRNKYIRAQIDTGAEVNLMPVSIYKLIYQDNDLQKLSPCNLKIGTYTADTINIIGTTVIYLIHPDTKQPTKTTFHIASSEGSVLLSCNASLQLSLIQYRPRLNYLPPRASLIMTKEDHPKSASMHMQIQTQQLLMNKEGHPHKSQPNASKPPKLITTYDQIKQQYPDIFEGTGQFPGPPYHINIDPTVPPKQTPCRPVLIHLKSAFQKEINQMLHAGVLLPVNKATPWINSFVLVEKRTNHGQVKLRICLDLTNLNTAIIREPYHFWTPDNIAHHLADACILTVCDCKKGYWHQALDEPSSYLTTFNTEIGRYRFTVMPFGITVAGDVFQQKLNECFSHIKNLIVIADDVMIIGRNENHKDHDIAFTTLLHTTRKCNIKLNYDKLKFKCTEVNFYGETYTTDGHKLAQDKIQAIVKMPPPCNKKEVQSFIGMINYLTKFSPCLTELSEPVRELTKEKVPFNWGPEHQESFEALKKELVSAPVLAYYNPRKETVLQTDASTKGLGACLLQEDKPIYFASKALTERGYVAIEIESLAVTWAVEKFHHFLYGCHFILETDQKPLEAILSRSLNQATPRIQCILIRTLPYNFTVRYIPGTRNLLADCLS